MQKALDLFDKAMSGDADALIKVWGMIEDAESERGVKNGKDKQRESGRNADKKGRV